MRVTFITVECDSPWFDEGEYREVYIEDIRVASYTNCMEPEDVQFYRDLPCPFSTTNSVLSALKECGGSLEDIQVKYITFTEEEYDKYDDPEKLIKDIWQEE